MSTELNCIIRPDVNVSALHATLRQYAIVYNPPYDVRALLAPYTTSHGRQIKVVIHHATRNVSLVDNNIRHHVLQTAVRAFQSHRIRMPSVQPEFRSVQRREPDQNSGQDCSICMEKIMRHDLQCLPCAHVFHRACIFRWLRENSTCPVCRMELT